MPHSFKTFTKVCRLTAALCGDRVAVLAVGMGKGLVLGSLHALGSLDRAWQGGGRGGGADLLCNPGSEVSP